MNSGQDDKPIKNKRIAELRKRRNTNLVDRMRRGEPLHSFDSQLSWFPPRPIIKKDRRAIESLEEHSIERLGRVRPISEGSDPSQET